MSRYGSKRSRTREEKHKEIQRQRGEIVAGAWQGSIILNCILAPSHTQRQPVNSQMCQSDRANYDSGRVYKDAINFLCNKYIMSI